MKQSAAVNLTDLSSQEKYMSTLKEVAEKANISITTVSRVINDPEKVKPKTRERVRLAMEALHFQPNRVAQRLRGTKGRSKLLGLIIPEIQNQFYSSIVRGIEDIAYRKNYAVILCNSDENPEKEKFYLETLRSESVDGIILPPVHDSSETIEELMKSGIPLICFDRKLTSHSVDTVVIDNEKGGYTATRHLLDLGHRSIAVVTSMQTLSSFDDRLKGYSKALKEEGIPIDEKLIMRGDHTSPEAGKELTHALLKLEPVPTALVVMNNQLTLGAIEALNESEYTIPDDVSIVGFDDLPWTKAISPPLTVMRQPGYEIGQRVAELFFQRIKDPKRKRVEIVMESELIVRKSSVAHVNDPLLHTK